MPQICSCSSCSDCWATLQLSDEMASWQAICSHNSMRAIQTSLAAIVFCWPTSELWHADRHACTRQRLLQPNVQEQTHEEAYAGLPHASRHPLQLQHKKSNQEPLQATSSHKVMNDSQNDPRETCRYSLAKSSHPIMALSCSTAAGGALRSKCTLKRRKGISTARGSD